MRTFRALASFALAVGLDACEGMSAPIPDVPARIVVVAGDGQRGLAGELLPRAVEVRVSDVGGEPLGGRRVRFETMAGAGSASPALATTDGAGLARTEWTLGARDVQSQRMRIAVDGGDSAFVEATALGSDETDVIVLRGALGPMKGIVLTEDVPGGSLSILQERVSPDTVIAIQPMEGLTTGMVAFPWAAAPAWARTTWTPGIDTAWMDLRPPVPVAMVVTVAATPFAAHRQTVENQIAELRRIWAEAGIGLELGVEIGDATDELGGVNLPADNACTGPFARSIPDRIHVYVVQSIAGSGGRGLACPPGLAFIAAETGTPTSLLAHEIGHLLGLDHVPFGLMQPNLAENELTDGQIFRVHFSERSALHLVFQAVPPEAVRDCRSLLDSGCLPAEYSLP